LNKNAWQHCNSKSFTAVVFLVEPLVYVRMRHPHCSPVQSICAWPDQNSHSKDLKHRVSL